MIYVETNDGQSVALNFDQVRYMLSVKSKPNRTIIVFDGETRLEVRSSVESLGRLVEEKTRLNRAVYSKPALARAHLRRLKSGLTANRHI
jgi:hypothetical protein